MSSLDYCRQITREEDSWQREENLPKQVVVREHGVLWTVR